MDGGSSVLFQVPRGRSELCHCGEYERCSGGWALLILVCARAGTNLLIILMLHLIFA